MEVRVYETKQEAGEAAAQSAAEHIRQAIMQYGEATIIVATGASQFEMLKTLVATGNLDEACRRQQLGEGWFQTLEDVPKQAISMSIQQILKARTIVCTVPDRRKAEAIRAAVEGPVTPMVPASILQQHSATTLYLDRE